MVGLWREIGTEVWLLETRCGVPTTLAMASCEIYDINISLVYLKFTVPLLAGKQSL